MHKKWNPFMAGNIATLCTFLYRQSSIGPIEHIQASTKFGRLLAVVNISMMQNCSQMSPLCSGLVLYSGTHRATSLVNSWVWWLWLVIKPTIYLHNTTTPPTHPPPSYMQLVSYSKTSKSNWLLVISLFIEGYWIFASKVSVRLGGYNW